MISSSSIDIGLNTADMSKGHWAAITTASAASGSHPPSPAANPRTGPAKIELFSSRDLATVFDPLLPEIYMSEVNLKVVDAKPVLLLFLPEEVYRLLMRSTAKGVLRAQPDRQGGLTYKCTTQKAPKPPKCSLEGDAWMVLWLGFNLVAGIFALGRGDIMTVLRAMRPASLLKGVSISMTHNASDSSTYNSTSNSTEKPMFGSEASSGDTTFDFSPLEVLFSMARIFLGDAFDGVMDWLFHDPEVITVVWVWCFSFIGAVKLGLEGGYTGRTNLLSPGRHDVEGQFTNEDDRKAPSW